MWMLALAQSVTTVCSQCFLIVSAHPLWAKFGTNSSSPAVVGGQQRLISGASLFILSAIPWKGGMGNRAPLAASLILFHILLASYKLLYMRLGFP